MIITLVKKETGQEFIKNMEKTYNFIEELEKTLNRTNNMKIFIDLENWKYYLKNPEETINLTESIVTDKLSITELELNILNTIKHEKPKSIRDLARKINKQIGNIQPKVKQLEQKGLIKFKDGAKNSKIPYLNYDEIKLEI